MSEVKCGENAAVQIYWPGKEPMPMCLEHAANAIGVSNVLGFYLHREPAALGATCEGAKQDKGAG